MFVKGVMKVEFKELWEMVSKAVLKSRQTIFTAFPS